MIIQITNRQQLVQAFTDGLINLYQEIFAEAPYFELFTEKDVKNIFDSYLNEGILFVKYLQQDVIGFSAARPFVKSSIYQAQVNNLDGQTAVLTIDFLENRLGLNSQQTWCLEDLGVSKHHRSQGLGTELTLAQIQAFDLGINIILRTSQYDNDAVQNFYHYKFRFKFLNITQDVEQLRQDGKVRSDRRLFMAKE